MSLTDYYLYFPQAKIVKAQLVPQSTSSKYVISMHIKSLIITPKHYPIHPILKGKADFYFALDVTDFWLSRFTTAYFNLFEQPVNASLNKIVGTEISLIARFSPDNLIKLETIGIGLPHEDIILYNTHFATKEMATISLQSQLHYKLSEIKKKTVRNKI